MADARWLNKLLEALQDEQIRDAFRSANYSSEEVESLTTGDLRTRRERNRSCQQIDLVSECGGSKFRPFYCGHNHFTTSIAISC